MDTCEHTGFHRGAGRYDAATEILRYVVVCDACGSELREVLVRPYAQRFDAQPGGGFVPA